MYNNIIVMDNIIEFNRETLSTVPKWIENEDWSKPNSIFNYGLPSHILHLIDLPISKDLTEADLLCSFITDLAKTRGYINYIEIGVSVGKTFYQIINFANKKFSHVVDIKLSCLDIEKINPNLEKILDCIYIDSKVISEIPSTKLLESMRNKETNIITKWENITYYESDEFDPAIWKIMDKKYNIIFSDALHEPSALICEYEQLKNNDLFDDTGFIYCFDDLETSQNGRMWLAVKQIHNDLVKTFPHMKIVLEHKVVNGWIGQHEFPHNFGLIRALC